MLLNMKLVAQIQKGLEVNLANSAGEHPSQHGHVVISARTVAKGKSTTLVSNKSSLCISCEEFKHSKSFAARARLLQMQIGVDCLCRSRALATKAVQFRLVRLRQG